MRYLPVNAGSYVDDFALCEPTFCGQSARHALRALARLLGLPFSDNEKKSLPMALLRTFLGVENDFRLFGSRRELRTSVSDSRQATLLEMCTEALQAGTFAACGGIDRFCGKLQFALTWSTNRVGRAVMQPLHGAAARAQAGAGETLGAAARLSTDFFRHLLKAGLPGKRHALRRRKRRSVLIWSDACWEAEGRLAGIGFVVYVPDEKSEDGGDWYYGYAAVTDAFMTRFVGGRKQYIGQLEMLAAVCVYYSLAHHPALCACLQDAPVVHFVDNYGAVAALCKGYASAIDSARIVHAYWALAASLGFIPWLSYVRSKGNIADIPSRLLEARDPAKEAEFTAELAYLTETLGATLIRTVVPDVSDWPTMAAAAAAVVSPSGAPLDECEHSEPPPTRRQRRR